MKASSSSVVTQLRLTGSQNVFVLISHGNPPITSYLRNRWTKHSLHQPVAELTNKNVHAFPACVSVYMCVYVLVKFVLLHFACVVDDAKCIVVTRVCVSLCVSVCLCLCLSAAVCPHYCTNPDVTWGRVRGCPLVMHYWADLQSMQALRCYGNIMRTLVTTSYKLVSIPWLAGW